MQTFWTFGSPHLGLINSKNKIFDFGLWLIKKWINSDSLKQMALTDNSNL